MIQPLRSYHRRAFLVLAVVLPTVFVAGLVARHKLGGPNRPVIKAFLVAGDDWKKHLVVVQLSRDSNGRSVANLLPTKPLVAPDVLVYFSEETPQQGSLPANARLLGKFDSDSSYPVPPSGFFILYSPAHKAVLDSVSVGGTS